LGLVRIEVEPYNRNSGKTEVEIRYYILFMKPGAAHLNSVIREHWGIENKLRRVLDVGIGEDLCRKRQALPHKTSPSSTKSLTICSDKTKPANSVSTANASKPGGTMITY
jgi:predicted transposase YbfD/YdcC